MSYIIMEVLADSQIILPKGAKILSVQLIEQTAIISALADPMQITAVRKINMCGPNHWIDKDPGVFIGRVWLPRMPPMYFFDAGEL